MNKQEIKTRKKNRGQAARKRMLILLATMLMITIGSVIFGSSFTSAQAQETKSEPTYKYYTSIVIEKGDSLWSIAQEYITSDYDNIQEYIEELIQLNSLTSETIHEGQHLLVAYYDTELK